jgi:hypothetical protein
LGIKPSAEELAQEEKEKVDKFSLLDIADEFLKPE